MSFWRFLARVGFLGLRARSGAIPGPSLRHASPPGAATLRVAVSGHPAKS